MPFTIELSHSGHGPWYLAARNHGDSMKEVLIQSKEYRELAPHSTWCRIVRDGKVDEATVMPPRPTPPLRFGGNMKEDPKPDSSELTEAKDAIYALTVAQRDGAWREVESLRVRITGVLKENEELKKRNQELEDDYSEIEADRNAMELFVRDLERAPQGRSTAPIVHFLNELEKTKPLLREAMGLAYAAKALLKAAPLNESLEDLNSESGKRHYRTARDAWLKAYTAMVEAPEDNRWALERRALEAVVAFTDDELEVIGRITTGRIRSKHISDFYEAAKALKGR